MDFLSFLGLARSLAVYRLNVAQLRRLRRLYRTLVQPGELVFDVGAHVGDRVWVLRAMGCRVVAVEPQPLPMRILRFLYGNAADVALEPCAVGAAPGVSNLLISRRNPTVSSLSDAWVKGVGATKGFRRVKWDRTQPVTVETLDTLIERHGLPRFCKIDVEGFEAEVLRGLTRAIPLISFEFLAVRRDLALACLAEIGRIGGYRFNITYGEKLTFAFPQWQSADTMADHLARLPSAIASGDIYAEVVTR